jgi:hypothetical protein
MNLSWELLFGLGALALLAALVWGVTQVMRRNRANDRVTEEATHDLYSHPDRYAAADREELKKRVRPS